MKTHTDEFELFWQAYPPRWSETQGKWIKADKFGARLEWKKLNAHEKAEALKALFKISKSKFTPDARKWLRHKRWEDIVDVKPRSAEERTEAGRQIQAMIDKLVRKWDGTKA